MRCERRRNSLGCLQQQQVTARHVRAHRWIVRDLWLRLRPSSYLPGCARTATHEPASLSGSVHRASVRLLCAWPRPPSHTIDTGPGPSQSPSPSPFLEGAQLFCPPLRAVGRAEIRPTIPPPKRLSQPISCSRLLAPRNPISRKSNYQSGSFALSPDPLRIDLSQRAPPSITRLPKPRHSIPSTQ